MSNINDLCAKCHRGRWRHTNPRLPGCHVFIEPPPQPAPSGDEAKVRADYAVDIAKRHWDAIFAAGGDQLDYATLDDACVEAYAAGKADGAREEREACARLVALMVVDAGAAGKVSQTIALGEARLAIARRGSEGK